jgi:hypothetical protein
MGICNVHHRQEEVFDVEIYVDCLIKFFQKNFTDN